MGLIRLFMSDAYGQRWRLLACLICQGAGIALVIALVGDVYHETSFTLDFQQFGYFVLGSVLIVFSVYQYRLLTTACSQEVIRKIRDRYAELIPHADLQAIEGAGQTQIYDIIARATTTLTEATGQIVAGTQSAANFVAMSLFILYLSPFAFAVLAAIVATMLLYDRYVKPARTAHFKTAAETERGFFRILSHVVWGFKEIKMNDRRGEDIERNFLFPASDRARDANIYANSQIMKGQLIGDSLFYVLWGTVVFIIPQYIDDRDRLFSLILCVTYMLQAVAGMVVTFPSLSHVDSAFSELDDLQNRLHQADRPAERRGGVKGPTFETLEMAAVVYTHRLEDGEHAFTLGPCNLRIRRSDIVVFRGGNGSGKSTLLKTLVFLYRPLSGSILWDGKPVDAENVSDYRNLFATVFFDFHLFDRLYGLSDRTEEEVNGLLQDFNIAHLTRYENGVFTRTDLSTGQRKRLALAVAILERRPILVLDEVAAEQDPEFREKFYREIVPRLKADGHTVLLSSHDDRYFDVADQIVVMRDGRIEEEDT